MKIPFNSTNGVGNNEFIYMKFRIKTDTPIYKLQFSMNCISKPYDNYMNC